MSPVQPRSKRWYAVIVGVTVVAVLATCGLFSTLLMQDELAGHGAAQAQNGDPTGPPMRDISSREVDPEPLTEEEVFPTSQITINPEELPYELVGTQVAEDCTVAGADALASLLGELDCSQAVRGTLFSPDGDYLVTTGVLNLATEEEADGAYEEIDRIIEEGTGRFVGMVAGAGTDPIVLSQTHSGWDYRGHFLIYAVIAKADGTEFTESDNRDVDVIIWDMVEVHLRTGVLEDRATDTTAADGDEAREADADGADSDGTGDGDGDGTGGEG